MLLSDRDLATEMRHGDLVVAPWRGGVQLQPASIEVHLDFEGRGFGFTLMPNQFRLAHTEEKIKLPPHLAARIEGKSSWARLGLQIHCAGFIDPGFLGQVTLELKNLTDQPITLDRGAAVGQLAVFRLSSPSQRPYGSDGLSSHYQGQMGTRQSYKDS